MEDSSGSGSPLAQGPNSSGRSHTTRSRSRSIVSNSGVTGHTNVHARLPSNIPQYNQDTHPLTDPSLLALTQQQIQENQPPIDTALLGSPSMLSPSTSFPIDPALGGVPEPSPSPAVGSTSTPVPEMLSLNQEVQPKEEDTREFETVMGEEENPGPSSGRNSKRTSAVVEDNDAELRRLAEETRMVPLDELARRVRNDENSPSAEKTRQVYGLGWLQKNCERVPDASVAVPRNRVYARYVGICANERIKPLNPASFGKLVRLMFPEIKTRRLGVRGQSKYHYCGIRLAGEQSSPKVSQGSGSASGSEPPAQAAGDDHLQVFNPSAPFLAELLTVDRMSNGSAQPFSNSFQTSIENNIENSSFYKTSSVSTEYPISSFLHQELFFSRNESDHLSTPNEILKLPNIDLYAPLGTDPDIAATLTAIYRSHCTSLVECVRYMRLKQFHQLFISFHGTLTAPVQKLLGEPSLALWIRESDWVMYKEMIRIFSSLLDRLLRVNDAAHAAARFLGNPPDRGQMIKDWKEFVNAQTIVDRELPCGAMSVVEILHNEVISLLQPPSAPDGGNMSPAPGAEDGSPTTESVLDRWTQFLTFLPHRFSGTEPRLFNLCLGAVASAALRDLTTNGAVSFGSWWVVRCWIDEWMGWLAERGGFLRHTAEATVHINRVNEDRGSIDVDLIDGGDEMGHDDSGISLRGEEPLNMLDDVGDDRDNRMVPVKFGK
ncbi:uncharacterized protein H6S33_012494 [Morchella sextelata]|uniref:uncharacterized protein n=1 Tax=Morchella sextelata TaxID=1174677 RepID=UPI001D04E032|nr:uncharacterized protein H6S33_012494 [Morchella sextelata]KAH0609948.1 hypothetical protein H6S33_012494 [Morchella sextelata]